MTGRKVTNKYIIGFQHSKLIITSKKYGIKEIIFNTEDYNIINEYSWYLLYDSTVKNFYVQADVKKDGKRTTVKLHRIILNPPSYLTVDHINRDTLNNTRNNLRICTSGENAQNKNIICTNTSGYRGVSQTPGGRWRARVQFKNKEFVAGTFDSALEAAEAAKNLRIKLFTHTVEG